MRSLLATFAALAALAQAGPALAGTKTVHIYGSFFRPASVTIATGDTVTWKNEDNANHQVLANKGEFVSPILKPLQSWSFTFRAAGIYHYRDELHPKLTGVVTVNGPPPTLTFIVSQSIVTYGTQITLSGIVSNHRAGELVTVYYKPYPQPNLIQRATVLTSEGGAFAFIAEPQVLTTYEVAWRNVFAPPATVEVQPKLSLGRNGAWIVHAYAAVPFAGRAVQLQRLNMRTGQWVTLKRVLLNRRSAARVSLTLPKGVSHLRVTMSVNQAGAGYLGAISPVVTWRTR